jgi:hypothetical protein
VYYAIMSASGGKTDDEKEPNKTNNDDTKEMSSFASHTDSSDDKEKDKPISRQKRKTDEMMKCSLGYREVVLERTSESTIYIQFPPDRRLATRTTSKPVTQNNYSDDDTEVKLITESRVHYIHSDTTEESSDKNKKLAHKTPRTESKHEP